ncbi:OapA family protein [Marinobacter sp. X15-166B]|uniref:OapA family protein n=1 Tax=Marinobacter sp. X15-166B TaxID=1897620 RepID=UPI00085CA77A|nr:peptidoglycan DD-metalloendopeptidase family protein [Marinobacter sp. X15-166B]OEY66530.1 peptidase M23 [Marinobacter sp. X15-166B]
MFKKFPRAHLAAAIVIGAVIGTAMIFSPSAEVEAKRMSVAIDTHYGTALPTSHTPSSQSADALASPKASLSPAEATSAAPGVTATTETDIPAEPALTWTEFEVKRGDTLSGLFKRAGYNDGLMLSVINGEGVASDIQKLYAGETIAFAENADHDLEALVLTRSRTESLQIERTETGFTGKQVLREPEVRTVYAQAEITSSLFGAGQAAGLSDKLTMELAGIFGWDIDFVLEVREGDRFSLVYEELYLDGEKIDHGKILSASFTNRGRELAAVLYTDENGVSNYYTPEGRSMRKAFLRTPVDFARISSNFNLQRRHPVLNTIRAHKGTDYAAATGTPIKATGDGRVIHVGRKGGYGNTVVLQHGNNITTLYAHMSKYGRGIKSGTRVKQGQIIGYVGATGLATGPHLHYEFRVNGTHRNPVTVKLPDAAPVPKAQLAHFKAATQGALAQLAAHQEVNRITLAQGE